MDQRMFLGWPPPQRDGKVYSTQNEHDKVVIIQLFAHLKSFISILRIWLELAQVGPSGSNLFPPRRWTDKLPCCWWDCHELCCLEKGINANSYEFWSVWVRFPEVQNTHFFFFWAAVVHYVFSDLSIGACLGTETSLGNRSSRFFVFFLIPIEYSGQAKASLRSCLMLSHFSYNL